jgi:hypothetical protein
MMDAAVSTGNALNVLIRQPRDDGRVIAVFPGCKKEKGRLLAPSLQFRNEPAAERYPVLRGEASHDKFR